MNRFSSLSSHLHDVDAPIGAVINRDLESTLTPSFKQQIEAFLASPSAVADPHGGPWVSNLDPTNLRRFVLAATQALIEEGIDPRLIRRLDDMLSNTALCLILGHFGRNDGFGFYVALSLIRVAEFCVAGPSDTLTRLQVLASAMAPVTYRH